VSRRLDPFRADLESLAERRGSTHSPGGNMSDSAMPSSPPGTNDGDSTTQDQLKDTVGQVQEKAQDAAGKAQEGLQQQVDQRAKKAGEQVSGTADDLRSVGEELRKQGKDRPAKFADQAAEQTEKVGSYLSGTGPDQMLHDLEDFGRRRPWALLAGGLVAGAAAARFLKASSRNRYAQRSTGTGSSAPHTPAPTPPAISTPPTPAIVDPPAPQRTGSPVGAA
jgi:hypothetical protein